MCAFAGAFTASVGAVVSWQADGRHHAAAPPLARAGAVFAIPTPTPSPLTTPSPAASPSPAAPVPNSRPAPAPLVVAPVVRPVVAARPATIVIGSYQQQLINQDRAAYGLPPLTWSSCLAGVAAQNAARMAAQGYISHANGIASDLNCGLGGTAGENLGYWTGGVDDTQLNSMFMNSPDHRSNILGSYTYVASAWVTASNGTAYLAVEFET